MNDSLDLPNVTDEQALGGPAIRLADYSDDTLEMSAGRVGKFGPGWTEAAHSADAWPVVKPHLLPKFFTSGPSGSIFLDPFRQCSPE